MKEIEKIINDNYDVEIDYSLIRNKISENSLPTNKKKPANILIPFSIAATLMIAAGLALPFVVFKSINKNDMYENEYVNNDIKIIKRTSGSTISNNSSLTIDIEFYVKGASNCTLSMLRVFSDQIKNIDVDVIEADTYVIHDFLSYDMFKKQKGTISYSLNVDNLYGSIYMCKYSYTFTNNNYLIK